MNETWLLDELERAAEESRNMPDWMKPVIAGSEPLVSSDEAQPAV